MFKTKNRSPFGMRSFPGRTDKVLDSDWDKTASHWTCVLQYGNHSLSVGYSMGSAHKGQPKVDNVVYSILMDSYAKDMKPEEFCQEYGYDSSSHKDRAFARWAIAAGRKSYNWIMQVLTQEQYEALQKAFEDY